MSALLKSLGLVGTAVVVVWLVGQMAGFHIALWPSLLISVAVTLILSFAFGGFRAGRRGG